MSYKDNISRLTESIDRSIAWIKANRPDQFERRFLQLVSERCRLRKIALTTDENPAIAAYGESQKGKSYVISNLLSDAANPFSVEAEDRWYDFVKEINPITNNVEATGVVTRFTTFSRRPDRFDPQYPVLIKLLSLAQVATILSDGYHSDITDYQSYSDTELASITESIYARYEKAPEQTAPVVTEDDILDMRYYLVKCTGGNTQSLVRSPYFDRVALIARRVPAEDWAEVFAPLWHRNATLTRLFNRLADALRRLSNAREVYLPIDAVLNTRSTLMSVQRINELGNSDISNPDSCTAVAIRRADGSREVIDNFDKSELSALCSEAVFKVDTRYLDTEVSYDMTMITDPTVKSLISSKPFKKDFLRHTDLLDFPGARARIQLKEENLDKTDAQNSMTNDANVYLRGKVAYLFRSYSDAGMINTLLFCHDNAQRSDDTLYITIDDWINRYVGDTPTRRSRTVTLTGGVSPFFIIATKFNIDMTMAEANPNDVANSPEAIDQRWVDRFNVVLFKEVIHGGDVDWFNNWTAPDDTFKNTYLLRDYKYSGDTGKGNNLYYGYRQSGRETSSAMPDEYYKRLRKSFVDSSAVRRFFADPALSWDVAATQGNDGSLLLFERLAIVASSMEAARAELNAAALRSSAKSILEIMKGYYHSDDAAKQLAEDINRACAIRRELIFACNRDNYFFGRLIHNLQTTERAIYNTIYDVIHSAELNGDVNNYRNYELIRKDLGARLDRCSSDNDNAQKWECLMMAYNFPDRQAAEDYLADRGIDPDTLFAGNLCRNTNSSIIAGRVFNDWISKIKSTDSINRLTGNGLFDPIEMSALVENIELTAKHLGLAERLEAQISEFVNMMNTSAIKVGLIADIMSTTINTFVCDLGFSLRDEEALANARKIVDDNPVRFDPLTYIGRTHADDYTHQQLTDLFNHLNANPEAVTPAFEDNYYKWIEYMVLSFLLKGAIIDYDIAANERLGSLISQVETQC